MQQLKNNIAHHQNDLQHKRAHRDQCHHQLHEAYQNKSQADNNLAHVQNTIRQQQVAHAAHLAQMEAARIHEQQEAKRKAEETSAALRKIEEERKVIEQQEAENQAEEATASLKEIIAVRDVVNEEVDTLAQDFSFLSTSQQALKAQELDACQTFTCEVGAQTKWKSIEASQVLAFASGMAVGIPAEFHDTVKDIYELATHPKETYTALKALVNDDNALGKMTDAVKEKWIAHIDNMVAAQERGGVEGYFQAGVEGGKLVTDVAMIGAGGVEVVKAGASAAKYGMTAGEKLIEKTASLLPGQATKYPNVKLADTNMKWGYPIGEQGNPFEAYVGKKFFPNSIQSPDKFKVYDYYDSASRHAVSVKTLNTMTDPKLAKPNSVHDTLKPYIDAIIDFKNDKIDYFSLTKEQVATRELMVGIPSSTTEVQLMQLQRTVEYGSDNGIKVTFVMVE
ncbi:hypothetical protein ABK905_22515 [Acerihabitans sp. KWT182]|uniref:CdiA toxin EC869-like domain-containing protein n=1 Tax=Acerihabitans sp. KWT182 TaxID=3157919 RepID=A0AAU7Q8B5_9GAMM